MLLLLLVASALPSRAAELSVAYDSSLADLSTTRAAAADEQLRIASRLLLADRLSAEGPTDEATELLDEIPPTPALRDRWPALAAYADALRCAHGIRRGRFGDYAPLCDVAVSEPAATTQPLLLSRIHWAQSFRWLHAGRYESGIEAAEHALREAQSAGSQRAEAWAWSTLGQLQTEVGRLSAAIDSFDRASALAASLRAERLSDLVADDAVVVHLELGNFARAQDVAERRLRWSQTQGQPQRAFESEVQLARAHLGLREARATLEILAPALAGDRTRHDPATLVRALVTQAWAHLELADADAALALLREGSALATALDHRSLLHELSVASIAALAAAGQQSEALTEALALRDELEAAESDELGSLLGVLAELAASQRRFDLASQALARRRAAADRHSGTLATRLALLEQDYALQRAERQIDVVREQRERERAVAQRNHTLLGLAASILALLAIAIWLRRARRHERRVADEQRYMAQELEGLLDIRSQALEIEMLQREDREAERRELERRLAEPDPTRALGEATGDFADVASELLQAVLEAADDLESSPEMPWSQQRERLRVIRGAATSALQMSRAAPPNLLGPSIPPAEGLEGLRALLVEDDDDVRTIVERQLISLGLEVQTARDAPQGLNLAEASKPDLLVTDVRLPGVDGVQLGRRALGLRPDLRVLLMSGLEGLAETTDFPLLTKPFSRAKLQSALLELVREDTAA